MSYRVLARRYMPLLRHRRWFGNINVPFQDDLTAADDDDFNLQDFQHYKESPDVIQKQLELLGETAVPPAKQEETKASVQTLLFEEAAHLREPVIFVSTLSNPYKNLAVEDYLFHSMPLPDKNDSFNFNRLMFYTNSPCVVIGKNQNPWKEVNIPLLNNLLIPLIRRRSGGGTVVHDTGNVNYSFMTTKGQFDRFKFVNIIKNAVNNYGATKYNLAVNERGDITTVEQPDGVSYKISGSAYKLAKGKSYHHGTMLLNLRLDILGKLLLRDESQVGVVDSMSSVSSVKSPVTNLELANEEFIRIVSDEFKKVYGSKLAQEIQKDEDDEYDQIELFGLTDFVEANSTDTKTFVIDDDTKLPDVIQQTEQELRDWNWRYGGTPKFNHEFTNEKLGFKIKFYVDKNALVKSMEIVFEDGPKLIPEAKIRESFEFLELMLKRDGIQYKGSSIAGFVTNDMISDWLGNAIDGTM